MSDSDKRDPGADVVRSVLEGLVIETPDGPMVLREVRNEPIVFVDILVVPDEPSYGNDRVGRARMSPDEIQAWDELDAFFAKHEELYKLSFGLEFSSIVDHAAAMDITPRRNHPKARQYPAFMGAGGTRAAAIRNVLEVARTALEEGESVVQELICNKNSTHRSSTSESEEWADCSLCPANNPGKLILRPNWHQAGL